MSGTTYAPVERLVAILGVVAALRFAERFGGRRVYVPQPERLKAEGALVSTLGHDAASKLAFEWRGQEIVVPICADLLRVERDRAIHADAAANLSASAIAAKYGVTERHVFRILAEPAPAAAAPGAAAIAQRQLFPDG